MQQQSIWIIQKKKKSELNECNQRYLYMHSLSRIITVTFHSHKDFQNQGQRCFHYSTLPASPHLGQCWFSQWGHQTLLCPDRRQDPWTSKHQNKPTGDGAQDVASLWLHDLFTTKAICMWDKVSFAFSSMVSTKDKRQIWLVSVFLSVCFSNSTTAKNTEKQHIERSREFPACWNTPILWSDRREECAKCREEARAMKTIIQASLTSQNSTAWARCFYTREQGMGIFPEDVSPNEALLAGPRASWKPCFFDVISYQNPEKWPWLTL